ncbi:MAG TPA: CocE/NonD family hydrolase [Candidatus Angelobacter sp.]|jgi:predicted acyl esterase|nr:CocE/NonD family hydrolase [Candidatus Angelobacter sp.]
MHHSRRFAGLFVAAALALLLSTTTAPAPAGAQTAGHSFVKTSLSLDVVDGPNNDHHVSIDADVYVPDNATASTPQPAIIYTNGFGGAKDDSSGVAVSQFFAQHGYVVLAYSSQGFGHSGGVIELDSPDYDVKDAEAMISYLATLPYVQRDGPGDPRVGMTGGSYGGGIQLLTAEFDPRLDVITPFRTWNSLEYSLSPNNLGTSMDWQNGPIGVFKQGWSSLFFASGATQPLMGNGGTAGNPALIQCPGFDSRLCSAYAATVASGQADAATKALIDASSPASYIDRLHIPTLLGQGESDTLFNLDESVRTYQTLKARNVPVKLIWQAGGHGYPDQPGEGDVFGGDESNPGSKFLPQQLLAWMDHYLRGNTGVDTGPGFQWFRDWVSYDSNGSAAPAFGSAAAYPAGTGQTFLLSGDNALVPATQTPQAGSAQIVNPPGGLPAAYSETPNFQAPGSTLPGGAPSPFTSLQPQDVPGQFAAFTAPPFAQDTEAVGVPTAHLHLSGTTGQPLVLFGKVFDVDAAGNATLIHRLVAPVRIPDASGGAVDMTLLGFAHLFPAGHAVRFELAATDTYYANSRTPDVITISSGGADPASFTLPVVAAAAAQPVVPASSGGGTPQSAASTLPNTGAGGPAHDALMIAAVATLLGLARRVRRRH